MGFSCCVPGCQNKSKNSNGIQFHRFPTDQQFFDLWLSAISRPDLYQKTRERIRTCYRVCSVHFANKELKLSSDSVPTLFLTRNPVDNDEFNATPAELNEVTKKPLGDQQQNGNNSVESGRSSHYAISVQAAKSSLDLDPQCKRIVCNVYSYVKRENGDFSENQVLERVSELTKINPQVVFEVISEVTSE